MAPTLAIRQQWRGNIGAYYLFSAREEKGKLFRESATLKVFFFCAKSITRPNPSHTNYRSVTGFCEGLAKNTARNAPQRLSILDVRYRPGEINSPGARQSGEVSKRSTATLSFSSNNRIKLDTRACRPIFNNRTVRGSNECDTGFSGVASRWIPQKQWQVDAQSGGEVEDATLKM